MEKTQAERKSCTELKFSFTRELEKLETQYSEILSSDNPDRETLMDFIDDVSYASRKLIDGNNKKRKAKR